MESATTNVQDMDSGASVAEDPPTLPLSHFVHQFAPTLERTLTCWSLLDGRARMIVKRNGSLVVCSENARDIMNDTDCLRLERGRLVATAEKDRALFAKILKASSDNTQMALFFRRGHDGHLIVRGVAIDNDLVCISLQCANGDHHIRLPDLGVAFRLTQSEARIAEDLYNGLTPQEIADRDEISIHTVRAHLRRCYDKLNITNREQLWHRLSAYQI